jgi:hypothetical protein
LLLVAKKEPSVLPFVPGVKDVDFDEGRRRRKN